VEITAPHKPCIYINKKHGTKNGEDGIQAFTHHNCQAGGFVRIIVGGELRDRMKFKRKNTPILGGLWQIFTRHCTAKVIVFSPGCAGQAGIGAEKR